MPWILLLGVAAALLGMAVGSGMRGDAAAMALPAFVPRKHGKQVGPAGTLAGSEIAEAPADLAVRAGVDPLVYALARMIASEASKLSQRIAVAWAARNNARARGYGDAVHRYAIPGGKFGQQGTGDPKRPVATTRPPDQQAVALAQWILGQPIEADPTSGAMRWFDWAAQQAMHEKWERGEEPRRHKAPETILKDWRAEGWVEVKRLGSLVLLGPTPTKLAAIRKAAGAVA